MQQVDSPLDNPDGLSEGNPFASPLQEETEGISIVPTSLTTVGSIQTRISQKMVIPPRLKATEQVVSCDTDATINAVSKDVVEQLGKMDELTVLNSRVLSFDDQQVPIIGCVQLNVELGGTHGKMLTFF